MDLDYDRAAGSLVGLAVGDALGTSIQNMNMVDMIEGSWSSSTSMAIALSESLLASDGLNEQDLLNRFKLWFEDGKYSHTGTCFGISRDTERSLNRFCLRGDLIATFGPKNKATHDSIKRVAPIAIFFNYDERLARESAATQSKTTHSMPACVNACQRMVADLIRLYSGETVEQLWQNDLIAYTPDPQKLDGLADDTQAIAKWALQTTDNFRDAVLSVINLGVDTDSLGAVIGQYAGARYGLSGIPKEWVDNLMWKDYILELAEKLYYEED